MKYHCFLLDGTSARASVAELKDVPQLINDGKAFWLDIADVDINDVAWLKETFEFHDLALQDVQNNEVRPKQEVFEKTLFTVFGAINLNSGEDPLDTINLNIFLTNKFIVSIHALPLVTIDKIIGRINNVKEVSPKTPGHVYYQLLDGVIDRYFGVLSDIDDQLEDIENKVFNSDDKNIQERIFSEKRRISLLKRSIRPKREALKSLVYSEFPQIKKNIQIYLRDVLDHVTRIDETLDANRDIISGLRESYMTNLSHKMNETMKILSVIATIMLPLSFLTGLFGMNFEVMPGLKWQHGFWILMAVMSLMVLALVWYFKRKKIID